VEPSEDPVNFAEQVDSALENPSASRKGRVKTEGYESDSSDDGEGVVRSRKPGAADEDNPDDDMFALGSEEKQDETRSKKKKDYLRLGDIEGQEFHSGSDVDSEEDEPEDEDDAERRKKAGMGYELSSFNMRDEMEEGKFTEDGSYVRSFDPHSVHDRWMEGLDEREIKMAKRRKRQQEKEQKDRMKAEERELEESGGKGVLEKELLELLKKGETVLEALQRLGAQARKTRPGNKVQVQLLTSSCQLTVNISSFSVTAADNAMNVDKTGNAPSEIEHITHLASNIMSLGDTDIYSKTYEDLVRTVRSSGAVDASWEPKSADVRYEYRWDIPGVESVDLFGPYGEEEMKAWYKASYFGPSGEKIKVRQVGGEWADWADVIQ
jgi:CD2 antigen cytoplasmic tail-binding protein 2